MITLIACVLTAATSFYFGHRHGLIQARRDLDNRFKELELRSEQVDIAQIPTMLYPKR